MLGVGQVAMDDLCSFRYPLSSMAGAATITSRCARSFEERRASFSPLEISGSKRRHGFSDKA